MFTQAELDWTNTREGGFAKKETRKERNGSERGFGSCHQGTPHHLEPRGEGEGEGEDLSKRGRNAEKKKAMLAKGWEKGMQD